MDAVSVRNATVEPSGEIAVPAMSVTSVSIRGDTMVAGADVMTDPAAATPIDGPVTAAAVQQTTIPNATAMRLMQGSLMRPTPRSCERASPPLADGDAEEATARRSVLRLQAQPTRQQTAARYGHCRRRPLEASSGCPATTKSHAFLHRDPCVFNKP